MQKEFDAVNHMNKEPLGKIHELLIEMHQEIMKFKNPFVVLAYVNYHLTLGLMCETDYMKEDKDNVIKIDEKSIGEM